MSVIRVRDRSFNNSWILHHTLYYTKTKIADDITFKIQSGFLEQKLKPVKLFKLKFRIYKKKDLKNFYTEN